MKIFRWNTARAKSYIAEISCRSSRGAAGKEKEAGRIVDDVRRNGDRALRKYTRRFDAPVRNIRVTQAEIAEAYRKVDPAFVFTVDELAGRVAEFEKKSVQKSWMKESAGVIAGQYVNPVESVGIYVPGGKAAYPSSLIMCAVPARLAGVKRIVVVTPPGRDGRINPCVLTAAARMSVKEIYKVGGAQAIAALAYGTGTIKKVDKIVGPGNVYVSAAKKLVRGDVEIDILAGPSEILVLADGKARPDFIAADLLSQAEHDANALCVCVTPSMKLAKEVEKEIKVQGRNLKRKEILGSALRNCAVIVTGDMREGVDIANAVAPEHLEILAENPFSVLPGITNAGAVFLGAYSPVVLGDYAAGPNHVIPTAGAARFSSPLSVRDFYKRSNVLSCDAKGFWKLLRIAAKFAEAEGLDAHANALKIRNNVPALRKGRARSRPDKVGADNV